MEHLQSCPVCQSNALTDEMQCKDFVASGETFRLQRCGNCSLLFTNPRPDARESGRYYQTDNYVSHAASKKGLIYFFYDLVKNTNLKRKLQVAEDLSKKGVLLDIGCGLGDFLNYATQQGWDAKGYDISEEARSHVKQKFGLEVQDEDALNLVPDSSVDVITMWHVLEHVHLLQDRVKRIKSMLKPGGVALVAVPNSSSYDASFYKSFWDGYDVPRHIYHFNIPSMERLMQMNGLQIVEKRPMIFDSYYISWRSEIHMKKKLGFIRAFFVGLLSNLKATKNRNFSSVLFVIRHQA